MDEIFTEYYEWAIRVANRVVGSSHGAEDIVSDVLLNIHKAMLAGRGPAGNVRNYLRRAIQNEATGVWARRRFEQVTDEVPEREMPDMAEACLRALQRSKDLAGYPPLYTTVLFRMDILGDSAEETAARLHVSVPAVTTILDRARSALLLAA